MTHSIGLFCKKLCGKNHRVLKFFIGLILVLAGSILTLDFSMRKEKETGIGIMERLILAVGSETYMAEIEANCYVDEEKDGVQKITLNLRAGDNVKEPVTVWIVAFNLRDSCTWEIAERMEHVQLTYPLTDDDVLDEYLKSDYLMDPRVFKSSKTGKLMEEEPRQYDIFTACLEGDWEEASLVIWKEIEAEEKHCDGEIVVNMPMVISWRDARAYRMTTRQMEQIAHSGKENFIGYILSNCVIDGNEIMEPWLNIKGTYMGDNCTNLDYVLQRAVPEPAQIVPQIHWNEEIQWIPTVIYHDLNYDKKIHRKSWVGSILITIGSSLAILPFSKWISKE